MADGEQLSFGQRAELRARLSYPLMVAFEKWLVYVLSNIHAYDKDYTKDLAELLPHNWNPKNL